MIWDRTLLSHRPYRSLAAAAAVAALLAAGCGTDGDSGDDLGEAVPDVTTSAAAAGGDDHGDAAPEATTTAGGEVSETADAPPLESDPNVVTDGVGETDGVGDDGTVETFENGDSGTGTGGGTESDNGGDSGSGEDAEPGETPADTPSEDDDPGVLDDDPQPVLADAEDSADFFGEVISWILFEDLVESGSQTLSGCLVAAFVDSIDRQRLDELAEAADDLDLLYGLGAEFLSDAEMAAFVDRAESCTTLIYGDGNIAGTFFGDLMVVPEEPTAEYEQAAQECTGRIVADESVREALLTVALFDAGLESDLRIFELLTERCGEALMVRMMAEPATDSMDLDYETALCTTVPVYRSLVESLADGVSAEESFLIMSQVRFSAFYDCGVPEDRILEIYGISDEPAPDEASSGESEPTDQP